MEVRMTTMAPLQEAVERATEAAIAQGEIGLQVAVYLHGELVAECARGLADWETGREVDAETLFTVFSATKGVAATALHVAAERGLLDYDRPVADYWPAFAAHGKGGATVRDVLTHAAGVPGMPPGCTAEQMCDWEWMCAAIAAMEPAWLPGTKYGYHAYTFGWLVGELVRLTDPRQRPFGQWIQEELCEPLAIDSLWLGIPDSVEPRVARLRNTVMPANAPAPPPDALILRAIPPSLGVTQEVFGRPDVRRSCHPGAGGIMNARSLAKHYALLAGRGQLRGVRLLSEQRVDEMRSLQSDAGDEVIGQSYRRGLGYWLGGAPMNANTAVIGPDPRALGHPGAGGSIGWADPEIGLGAAILKNRMLAPATPDDTPLVAIADAIREAVPAAQSVPRG
jgi:CubicO group peptidase (beta-lactamase class C family)